MFMLCSVCKTVMVKFGMGTWLCPQCNDVSTTNEGDDGKKETNENKTLS